MGERVAILRSGDDYKIYAKLVNRELSIEVDLADFMDMVAKEIGPVSWVFRDATFRARFDAAVEKVRNEVQKASTMVA